MYHFALCLIAFLSVSFGLHSQSEPDELSQFYTSAFEPIELNTDSYDRLKNTYKKYLEENGNIAGFDEKSFVFEYNYFLDRINRSGNVFYGDSISSYVNKLKDWILKKNNIQIPIRVYLTDYVELNAFTNDFGNIYVNIATIAKLDSEEELLVILAHEIGHILLHHSRESEMYAQEIDKEIGINVEESSFKLHAFSRAHELSADSIAITLLKGVVAASSFQSLFDKLENSENPAYTGRTPLEYLLPVDSEFKTEFEKGFNSMLELPLAYQAEDDSLSTHPSIDARRKYVKENHTTADSAGFAYNSMSDYADVKLLASKVLINSYLQRGQNIEALDLILKVRSVDDKPWLLEKQAKAVLLLIQENYEQNIFDLVKLNIGCNDEAFIKFKQYFCSMSKIDINIYCHQWIKANFGSEKTEYSAQAEKKAFQYLYHYSPSLFVSDSVTQNEVLINWDSDLQNCDWLKHDSTLIKLKEVLDSLGYAKNCFAVNSDSTVLLESFLSDYRLSEIEYSAISEYQKETSTKTETIALENIDMFLHPALAADRFHRGVFYRADGFDHSKKSVLIQSDNLFFVSKHQVGFKLDYRKSLKLESQLSDLSERYNSFSENYAFGSGDQTTVLDNYLHKSILLWMGEATRGNSFHYSAVQEEIDEYLVQNDVQYIVYRLSILNRNKGRGRRYNVNYYELYFDVESGGVVYVAEIGSKQFPDRFQVEQMVYLSELNKKK